MSANPYAAPTARLQSEYAPAQGCWRTARNEVYVSRYSDLPHRCVKCNEPARRGSKLRSYYWHSSAWYLLILLNLFVYAIVASFVRKKTQVSPGLCDEHSRQRARRVWSAVGFVLAGILAAWICLLYLNPWLALGFFLAGLFAATIVSMIARPIYPVYIDERGARFKGCGSAFLESLDASSAS